MCVTSPRATWGSLWHQYEAFGRSKAALWRRTGTRPARRQTCALVTAGTGVLLTAAALRRPPVLVVGRGRGRRGGAAHRRARRRARADPRRASPRCRARRGGGRLAVRDARGSRPAGARPQVMSSIRWSATRAQLGGLGIDDDLVHQLAPDERLEAPGQVRRVDAEHRRARAHERVERDDRLVRVVVREPLHHVDLGADADDRHRPARPRPTRGCARSSRPGRRPRRPRASTRGARSPRRRGARRGTPRRARGVKRWCTEHQPRHRQEGRVLDVALLEAAELRAAGSRRACRPRRSPCRTRCCGRGAGRGRTAPCRRGRTPTRGRRGRSTTCTPRRRARPTNALMRRRGVHVGDRDDPVDVGDAASASHASSTWSRSAMSAIEQPALRSGRITRWWSPVRTSADSAMKCTPQKTMSVASRVRREAGELERVAPGVGPLHDLVALVVVTEDQQPGAELGLGRADHVAERVGIGGRVAVRQGCLQSQHGMCPLGEGSELGRRGQPGRHSAGLSASEPICGTGVPGRPSPTVTRPPPAIPAPCPSPAASDHAASAGAPTVRIEVPGSHGDSTVAVAGGCDNGARWRIRGSGSRSRRWARRRPRPRQRAVRDGHLVFGPDLPAFEAALAAAVGADDAVATVTGTAALHLALRRRRRRPRRRGLGVAISRSSRRRTRSATAVPGSCWSTASPLVEPGPRPSWSRRSSAGPTPARRCRRRSSRSTCSAIPPTSRRSSTLAAEHGIAIVEDAAESLGIRWRGGMLDGRAPGSVGDLGIYSFNFNKPISTGGGGMLVAQDPDGPRPGPPPRHPGEDPRLRLPARRDRLQRPPLATSPPRSA